MKIFITGATGYIGHHLALTAAQRGYSVSALVRSLKSDRLPLHPAIQLHQGDVTDYESVVRAMQGCDAVLHAAALARLWHKDESLFYKINVQGTENVLKASIQQGINRFVFTSSCAVLGPSNGAAVTEDDLRHIPFENGYETSKHQAEVLTKEYSLKGLHTVIVAPPRVYGPGLDTKGNPINNLIRNTLKRRLAFMPAAKEVVGNYAYVDDVVNGHFLALEKGRSGEKYILGGENVSYKNLFETMLSASERKIAIVAIPIFILKAWTAAVFGANFIIGRHTHLSPKVVARLMQNRAVSSEKAVRELGYQITPFAEGIAETVRFLNNSNPR